MKSLRASSNSKMENLDFNSIIAKDVNNLWEINHYFNSFPKIRSWMSSIVSRHPFYDICAIIWVISFIGVLEIGWKHFWVVSMNLTAAFVLRKVIQAKRPVEYDIRLQPTSDLAADSFAFPSLESYMSVVITGHFVLYYQSFLLFLVACALSLLVGVSRLYTKSRFPHQIIGSYFLGFIGLLISLHLCEKSEIHKWDDFPHGTCVGFCIVCLITNFALNMENNDSRLVWVPKKEFVKVISGIINSSSESNGENVSDPKLNNSNASSSQKIKNEGSRPEIIYSEGKKDVKHDSFYYLQKTIEGRSTNKLKKRELLRSYIQANEDNNKVNSKKQVSFNDAIEDFDHIN